MAAPTARKPPIPTIPAAAAPEPTDAKLEPALFPELAACASSSARDVPIPLVTGDTMSIPMNRRMSSSNPSTSLPDYVLLLPAAETTWLALLRAMAALAGRLLLLGNVVAKGEEEFEVSAVLEELLVRLRRQLPVLPSPGRDVRDERRAGVLVDATVVEYLGFPG
jgi:hypothetical protein